MFNKTFIIYSFVVFSLIGAPPAFAKSVYTSVFDACLKERLDAATQECLRNFSDGRREGIDGIAVNSANCSFQTAERDEKICRAAAKKATDALAERLGESQSVGTTMRQAPPRARPTSNNLESEINPTTSSSKGVTTTPEPPEQQATQDTSDIAAQVRRDVQACEDSRSQAFKCCKSPLSSGCTKNTGSLGMVPGAGLADACAQAQKGGGSMQDLGRQAASVCSGVQNSCTTTCSNLQVRYQQESQRCAGCAAQSLYDEAVASLNVSNQNCEGLTAQVINLTNYGLNGSGVSAQSALCSAATSMAPAAMGALGMGSKASKDGADPFSCEVDPTNPVCQAACAGNPNGPGCEGVQEYGAKPSMSGGFVQNTTGAPKYNPPDISLDDIGPTFGAPTSPKGAGPGATIANNSGGQVPGGQASPASLNDGKGGARKAGAAAGTTVNLEGERGGGGYTQPTSGSGFESDQQDGSGGLNAPGGVKAGGGRIPTSIDLKAYLPGGPLYQSRRVGGSQLDRAVRGRSENLFVVISAKIQERCKLGRLACPDVEPFRGPR